MDSISMNTLTSADNVLIADIRELIDRARQRAATAVNAELTLTVLADRAADSV